jgi:hypothetical protein
MNPVIIDGFLKHDEFKKLQTYMMSPDFQWRFMPVISHINEKGNKFQFVHLFYQNCKPISPDYSILAPVFRAINMKSLYRIKSNLLTRTPEIVENDFHYDVSDFTPEQAKHWTTSILYINTNNGYTKFETGEKIESVENRLITFSANLRHTGASCSDERSRVVINFNYFT